MIGKLIWLSREMTPLGICDKDDSGGRKSSSSAESN